MNYKRFKRYIVVDEENRPMAYEDYGKKLGQFYYCQSERNRRPFPLKTYTFCEAKKLIKKTHAFRRSNFFQEQTDKYYLMPIR